MNPVDNQSAARVITNAQPNPHEFLDYVRSRKSDVMGPISVGGSFFVTADDKMKRVCEIVGQIANANVSVLITGESGTGKEVIARMIHETSSRRDKPFVAVNCAAVPATLLESELFGHERGSFTGADQRHVGKFELANKGTLLLDEVTEIEPGLQAKLLRALQEKEIERVGGNGPIPIDTRIIATSNRDIAATVKQGGFRQDLFYRLYVINLEIPPLRARRRDIELLGKHFLEQFSTSFGRPGMSFSNDALDKLLQHSWPGNVRELQNIIQRSVLMSKSNVVTANDIPLSTAMASTVGSLDWVKTLPLGRQMRDVERHFIIETLKHHSGNRTHAAKTLGISLRTLRNKINEFTAAGHEIPAPTTGKAL